MNKLPLQVKISIKGILHARGLSGVELATIDAHKAVFYWYPLTGSININEYYKKNIK